jgi:hypothetical protein
MKTLIIILLSSIFLFSSCTEKIDISLEESASKVVIEGSITNEFKEHEVRVTRSTAYLARHATPVVSGAIVRLSDGSTEITLTESAPGIYKTIPAMAGIVGKEYTLTVIVDGMEYRASERINNLVPIDSMQLSRADIALEPGFVWEEGKTYYNLGLYLQEPGDQVNFYLFDTYKNGELVTDTLTKKHFVDDMIINGSYINGMYAVQVDAVRGDSITLQMYTISKKFCYFLLGAQQSGMSGNPFTGTPANVGTNFSGGALGYFWAGGMTTVSGVVR